MLPWPPPQSRERLRRPQRAGSGKNRRVGPCGGGASSVGVGAIDPHESARIVARDLAPVVSELASLKGEVYRGLERHHEYRALAHRLEAAHTAAEAALV